MVDRCLIVIKGDHYGDYSRIMIDFVFLNIN